MRETEPKSVRAGQRSPIRDLVDFYVRWPEQRPIVLALSERDELSADERTALHWLVMLADRVGRSDVSEQTALATPREQSTGTVAPTSGE